ncbi:hypothetical protein ASG90_18820 [Nocardioides sp. Soil797]|nr:hypothetical protein ASG90_18820 [Nocardioides sp. Soil797]
MPWTRADRSPLLKELCSRDTQRVRHAISDVRHTRDPELLAPLVDHLDLIRRRTRRLGAAATVGLDRALERIAFFRDGVCLCASYRRDSGFNPAKEAEHGHVRIVEEIPVVDDNGTAWPPVRVCACTGCGQAFDVHDREYHAPWWEWIARPEQQAECPDGD